MKPYIRVYDRAGNYAPAEFCNKKGLVADLQEFCETGIDRVVVLDSTAGGTTIMRLSDVTSIVDMDEEIIRVSTKLEAEEQKISEEAKEEDEPSWK